MRDGCCGLTTGLFLFTPKLKELAILHHHSNPLTVQLIWTVFLSLSLLVELHTKEERQCFQEQQDSGKDEQQQELEVESAEQQQLSSLSSSIRMMIKKQQFLRNA